MGSAPSNANTSNGLAIFRSIDLDESEEEVKASPGSLFWVHIGNTNAAARYVKFYNATAANTTVGTTTPVMTIHMPATTARELDFGPYGLRFDTAITVAATTGIADNDTGAPGANEVIINIGYDA